MNKNDNILLKYFLNVYKLNYKNYIKTGKDNFNIILDNKHIPNKLVSFFYKNLTKDKFNTLINNALIYALNNNKVSFINKYKSLQEKIINYSNLDNDFKRESLIYGISSILEKNTNDITKEDINFIVTKYKDLFRYINSSNNIEYTFINDLYRNIIFTIINRYSSSIEEKLISNLLTTSLFDDEVIEISNGVISNNNINSFKVFLYRIIIQDTYIFLKCLDYDTSKELFKKILIENNLDDVFDSKLFLKLYHPLKNSILTYIENCRKTNNYQISNDTILMGGLFRTFVLSLRLNFSNKENIELIENIERDDNLNSINPCYKFDKIKKVY